MTAYNRMGWLCNEPRVPRQVPDQARIDSLENSQQGSLNEDHAWFVSGDSPFEQLDHFLQYLLSAQDTCNLKLASLLERTCLEGQSRSVIEDARLTFSEACSSWKRDYVLTKAWLSAIGSGARNSVLNAIHYQARSLWQTETISALAEKRFLPRYGFPIDVQALTVQTDGTDEPVRFQRSSTLALSEYVPGSVLLGGAEATHRMVCSASGHRLGIGALGFESTCTVAEAAISGRSCSLLLKRSARDALLMYHAPRSISCCRDSATQLLFGISRPGKLNKSELARHRYWHQRRFPLLFHANRQTSRASAASS